MGFLKRIMHAEIKIGVLFLHPPLHIVRPKLDHSCGEPLILAHRSFGRTEVASLLRDLAYVKDVLSVIVEPLRVVRLTADGLCRADRCLAVQAQRSVDVAAQVCNLGHKAKRARTLQKRVIG